MSTIFSTPDVEESVGIEEVQVSTYKIPTQSPEADGTLKWSSTTMILVEITAGGKTGLGYSFAHEGAAKVITSGLRELLLKQNVMHIPAIVHGLKKAIRNQGMAGISMMAISAVDVALWDLKAKLLDLPLFVLLGKRRDGMLLYGSGGFTSYSNLQLKDQLGDWAGQGFRAVKMKVGSHPDKDVERVKDVRSVLSNSTEIFVDANGAYTVKQSIQMAEEFAKENVTWFEEPVSSDNVEGLRFIREHVPAKVRVVAGEYGFIPQYFKNMVSPLAVDVVQADATRCGGISGFMEVGMLCAAFQVPFSSHCAPYLHLHAAISLPSFSIAEYFFDHVRIENMLFKSSSQLKDGILIPDATAPGIGMEFKYADADKYKIN